MKELIENINQIAEFGISPKVELKNKVLELKQLLVSIYNCFLNSEDVFDNKEYRDNFDFPYEEIKENVEKNFLDFGWYISINDIHKVEYKNGEPKSVINSDLGDPIDDISDIIKDLLEVKWRVENTSKEDAIWHFRFLMKNHAEKHLVDLLKFLKDFEG